MKRRDERERVGAERHTLPHVALAEWARSQLGVGGAASWWCAACRTQKSRADVRLEIEGREARHVCRCCGLVLDREEIPF
jgi:hypothetical protein